MQNTLPQTPMGQLWNSIQSWLLPMLEDGIGALDANRREAELAQNRFFSAPDTPATPGNVIAGAFLAIFP